MELQFRGKVGGVGGFGRVEIAKVLLSPIEHDPRLPALFVLAPRNPEVTANVVLRRLRLILHVHGSRHVTEISDPVVCLVTIDVINLLLRPRSMRVQPRQSVRPEVSTVNHNNDVALAVERSSGCANFDPVAKLNPPPKNSSVGVVVQQALQRFACKVGAFYF